MEMQESAHSQVKSLFLLFPPTLVSSCLCSGCASAWLAWTHALRGHVLVILLTRGDGFSPPLVKLHQTIRGAYGSISCCDFTELTVEGSNCVLSGEPHCLNTCVHTKEVELSGRSMQSLLTATCSLVFKAFWHCSRSQLQLEKDYLVSLILR